MESHSSHRAAHQEKHPTDSNKIDAFKDVRELSETLQARLAIAKAMYTAKRNIAQKFDDSQEVFSSKAENLLLGYDLIARAALRAVDTNKN